MESGDITISTIFFGRRVLILKIIPESFYNHIVRASFEQVRRDTHL